MAIAEKYLNSSIHASFDPNFKFVDGEIYTASTLVLNAHTIAPFKMPIEDFYSHFEKYDTEISIRQQLYFSLNGLAPSLFRTQENFWTFKFNENGKWFILLNNVLVRDEKFLTQLKLTFG